MERSICNQARGLQLSSSPGARGTSPTYTTLPHHCLISVTCMRHADCREARLIYTTHTASKWDTKFRVTKASC